MANIFIPQFIDLPADVFLHIFRYLDMEDMIAFAATCQTFRQMCVDAKVFRKMDLSRRWISTAQRDEINKFFRDRQLTQHIRELNVSNLRVLNWQMDNQLEEFIISICPQLEALHVLDCAMSLQRLHRILKQAPKLTSLSWSLWDFTSDDIEFLVKCPKSSNGICLKNIKHLHIETPLSVPHIQIVEYLVLNSFINLEELEIHTWLIDEAYYWNCNFPFMCNDIIPDFLQPSVKNELQHLHSLMVIAVGGPLLADYTYTEELFDFVISVLSRKSCSTKWKKLWILPSVHISTRYLTDFSLLHKDDFQSVEAIAANPGWSANAMVGRSAITVDELKTFFEGIGDNTVRSLHFCLPRYRNSIVEFCEPNLRVGGHSLEFLRLPIDCVDEIGADENVFIHTLFSNCSNITELDLLGGYFEKNVCEPLSELKHLTKVQLLQCAISSKYCDENQVEISKATLFTFVENCQNITHFDVRGCDNEHEHFSCRLTDGDLLALAKLRNLKSLTLYKISGIREWTFLQHISEHCKFWTMLRICSDEDHFNDSHISVLMDSCRFLQHLALAVPYVPVLGSNVFWNLLSHAKNLQRLCLESRGSESLNIPVAMETLKSLPQLHVLHLHPENIENVEVFHSQMKRMLEEKESNCKFSFEIVTGSRMKKWINHQTGYSLVSDRVLPLNVVELCEMRPLMDIPWF